MQRITIGLDLAKHVFQVHGVDERGEVVFRRRLRRVQVRTFFAALEPCLIWRGGLRHCAFLGPRVDQSGARGTNYSARLCEALCSPQ